MTVLKTGLSTGNEHVIAIDCNTGKKVADKIGTPIQVKWQFIEGYSGNAVTIHNHPSSTPFSPRDLYYFGSNSNTKCMGVQGHNGILYSLRKTENTDFHHTENSLRIILTGLIAIHKDKTNIEIGEIFIQMVAEVMKWEFLKGGV